VYPRRLLLTPAKDYWTLGLDILAFGPIVWGQTLGYLLSTTSCPGISEPEWPCDRARAIYANVAPLDSVTSGCSRQNIAIKAYFRKSLGGHTGCKLHREEALIGIAKWHFVYEGLEVHHEGDASWLNEPRQENRPFSYLRGFSRFQTVLGAFCG
jgi:hypothetical protein